MAIRQFCTRILLTLVFVSIGAFVLIKQDPKRFLNGVGKCHVEKVDRPVLDKPTCVVLTGATSGIGEGMAKILSKQSGVRLVVTGRTLARAKAVLNAKSSVILAAALDLELDESIDRFVEDVKIVLKDSCHGKMDYLILNAAMLYAPGYNETYSSRNGEHDRLFSANYVGTVRLLKGLLSEVKRANTRVVFVSSVAHVTAVVTHDATKVPVIQRSDPIAEGMAYSYSKLALTATQQLLAKDGLVTNSVAVTCGAVDTNIYYISGQRPGNDGNRFGFPFNQAGTMFSSDLGTELTLDAAFLRPEQAKTGEFVYPYFYGFSESWLMSKYSPSAFRLAFNVVYEQTQKLTYIPGHVWVCPTSPSSRDEAFQQQLKKLYL